MRFSHAPSIYSIPTAIVPTSNWLLTFTLDNPNGYYTSANDLFGQCVAIDGDYAIVGAYGERDVGGVQSGKAYIYQLT